MSSKKLDEDNYHQYATPTSTLSSGFGNYYGGFVQEHNLPEVRIDNSPQALSRPEAECKRKYFEDSEPKFPAIYDDTPKTVVLGEESGPSASPTTTGGERALVNTLSEKRKILGLRPRVFVILLVVILVAITIAVGAGVGIELSSKSRSSTRSSADSAPGISTSLATSSRTQAPTIASQSLPITTTSSIGTSSAHPSPTSTLIFLNNQTTPSSSFAFQGFAAANYLGNATSIIRTEGGTDFPFELNSYVWLPNTTACCVSFCLNATNAGLSGWWCDERYRQSSSGPFGRIFVWCGQVHSTANAVCV